MAVQWAANHDGTRRLREAAARWRQADAAVRSAWDAKAPPVQIAALKAELAAAINAYHDLVAEFQPPKPTGPPDPTVRPNPPMVLTLLDPAQPDNGWRDPIAYGTYLDLQAEYERAARERQTLRVAYESAMASGDGIGAHDLAARVQLADDAMTEAMRGMLSLSRDNQIHAQLAGLVTISTGAVAAWAFLGLSIGLAISLFAYLRWGLSQLAPLLCIFGPVVGIVVGLTKRRGGTTLK